MKANTSLSMDASVLDKARAEAKNSGSNLSTFVEGAVKEKLMRIAAAAAADWERGRGMNSEDYAAQLLAEQEANLTAAYGPTR